MAQQKQDGNKPVDYGDTNAMIKHVLKTVTERCKIEAMRKDLMVPLNDQEARIAFYTGLPNSLVTQLLSDVPRVSTLDLASRILVLETVKSIYTQTELPIIYSVIFEKATDDGEFKTNDGKIVLGLNVFMEEMNILGYQCRETVDNSIIVMENPEVRFERFMYLNKLKKFRNSSSQWEIVYVDERVINNGQKYQKQWLAPVSPKASESTVEESVFYHAVSKNGFITGLFSNQASEKDFSNWFRDILIMQLKAPSVIIMDSNPMHGSLENVSYITRYHCKKDMLRWLTNNNIPCSSSMSKPALYELIQKCNLDNKEYKLDRIVRSEGHEILRLPRHLYDLSITTLLWDEIVQNGGVDRTNTLMELQNDLMAVITSISLPKLAEYEGSIEKQERDIFDIDVAMEMLCDKFDMKLN